MTALDAHIPRSTDHDSSRRRRLPGLLLIVLTTALAAGCGLITDVIELGGRIEDAGYQQVEVNHNVTNGRDVVTIVALTQPGTPTDDDLGTIAEIVWTTYPRTVDEIDITLDGREADPISRDQLVDAFGERDPALDNGTGIGQVLLIGLIGVMTVLALVVVLVIVLVRRSHRKAARTAPPSWPSYSGMPYPQPPPFPTPPPPSPPFQASPGSAPSPRTPPASAWPTPAHSASAPAAQPSAPPPSQPQPPDDVRQP